MAVPDFQTIMRPMLDLLSDGRKHGIHDLKDRLAVTFRLSQEELAETIASGKQGKFANRVAWSGTHLYQAGLVCRPERAHLAITDRGRAMLSIVPQDQRIEVAMLLQYPEYQAFRTRSGGTITAEAVKFETPEELFHGSYQQLREALAEQVKERVANCSPAFFERLVVDLLVAMGYGGTRRDAGQVVGGSGDGGIDGIIKEDRLGLDVVYLQAKRWKDNVSRPTVQAFAGSLEMHRARKGVLITTSGFTADARDYASRIEKRIVLIDGQELAELMIDHGIGVTDIQTYTIRRIDSDYFEEA